MGKWRLYGCLNTAQLEGFCRGVVVYFLSFFSDTGSPHRRWWLNKLSMSRLSALVLVCDNCKQAVVVNQDWIEPELNKDYADWADHYGTVILPAKVRKPKFKSSVEKRSRHSREGLLPQT